MGSYVWDRKNLANFFPIVLSVEIDRFFPGIAPKPNVRAVPIPGVDRLEQGPSHPGALASVGNRHAPQLVPIPQMGREVGRQWGRGEHQACAADHLVLVPSREVSGGRQVVADKSRRDWVSSERFSQDSESKIPKFCGTLSTWDRA